MRTAALGSPVLPLVNVRRATSSLAHGSMRFVAPASGARPATDRVPGSRPPIASLIGSRRIVGETIRRACARGVATNARGLARAQQRSM